MALTIRSPAFAHEAAIPARHTCQGDDVAPALEWSGAPEGTKSLVLIVDDPDAPDPKAPKMTWVHWVVYNLPAASTGLAEGAAMPEGAGEGLNDWKRAAWGGPCPPIGRHRYFFKLYAVDVALDLPRGPTKPEVEAAMDGHVLERAELMGTYQKT